MSESKIIEIYNQGTSQVIDMPEIKVKIAEHRSEVKLCPKCRRMNPGSFPTVCFSISFLAFDGLLFIFVSGNKPRSV